MKPITRFGVALAILGAIGACSSDSNNGPDYDGTATTAATLDAGDNATALASDVVGKFNFGHPNIYLSAGAALARIAAKHPFAPRSPLGARLDRRVMTVPGLVAVRGAPIQFSVAPGCSISSYGTDDDPFDPYDGNENDLPDDWGVKYICVDRDTSDAENVVTHRTSIEITVKEISAALYGYTSKFLYEEKYSDEEGNEEGFTYNGVENLDIRGGAATSHETFRYREWGKADGVVNEGIDGEAFDGSFDPTGPIVLGDPLPNGQLDFTGKQYHLETDDVSLSFTLDTPTKLAYSAACRASNTMPPFTSGVIRGRLNGNGGSATFTDTFTDCNVYTIATENTDDPVPEVAVRR